MATDRLELRAALHYQALWLLNEALRSLCSKGERFRILAQAVRDAKNSDAALAGLPKDGRQ